MTKRIKVLNVAIAAIAAMSVAVAPAQAGSFDTGAQSTVLTGHDEGHSTFTFQETDGGTGSVTCQTHSLEGTIQGQQSVSEFSLTTTKGGQCLFNGIAATVRMNGCKDTFTGAPPVSANTYLVDIVGCTNSAQGITITVTGCQLRILEQNGLSHVIASNLQTEGAPHEVTLTTTATGITLQQVGLACPDGNGHVGHTGATESSFVLKGYVDAGTHQVTAHNHQYQEVTEGAQVGITST